MRQFHSRRSTVILLSLAALAATASAQNVRYVRADGPAEGDGLTWKTAYRSVAIAVQASPPGTDIWVAAGTYRIPNPSGILLRPTVSLYGGFTGTETDLAQRDWSANTTVISGDVNGDDDIGGSSIDNGLVFNVLNNVLANTVVDGFTIRSGRASQGGAFRINGSPTIRNCTITRHNTDNFGGTGAAVYIQGSGLVSPRFINCTFSRNGALFGSQGVVLTESTGADARFVDCTFVANNSSAVGVVGVRNSAALTLVNCAVISNTVRGSDGAVFVGPGTPAAGINIINCTIAGNTCTEPTVTAGLRVINSGTPLLVRNCVLWGNAGPGIPVERAQFAFPSPQSYRLDYCRVDGWSGLTLGTGTSSANPLLADLDGPDDLPGTGDEIVTLLPGSSCIDAGNNGYVWPDVLDLDGDGNVDEPTPLDRAGNPRFTDDPAVADTGVGTPPIVDIGAYERAGLPAPCRADFNGDGSVNSQDFFEFLQTFFTGC